MTRRARLWRAGAVLFGIINIAGMGLALAMNEMMHAMARLPVVRRHRRLSAVENGNYLGRSTTGRPAGNRIIAPVIGQGFDADARRPTPRLSAALDRCPRARGGAHRRSTAL